MCSDEPNLLIDDIRLYPHLVESNDPLKITRGACHVHTHVYTSSSIDLETPDPDRGDLGVLLNRDNDGSLCAGEMFGV